MAENKRYYWLKLNENFFEDDTMTWLEEQENGKEYIIFYLKLCLKSLSDDGHLVRYVGERLIPYDVNALSRLTNTNKDTVSIAMKLFIEIGLVNQMDSGEIYMTQINEMIGSETDSAKRMRKLRIQEETQRNLPASHCDMDVQNSDTEKELEIERELEKDSTLSSDSTFSTNHQPHYKPIIDHLNEKTGKHYKHTTNKTQKVIRARWNEGFEEDDFKKVINNKVAEWKDTDMDKYLRPETLFGTKFESYLNQSDSTDGTEYKNKTSGTLDYLDEL